MLGWIDMTLRKSPGYDSGQPMLIYMNREKARIPAWTDRILRKGTNIRQLAYNSAPLRFSDHRPVFAIFQCAVNIIDEPLREKISRQLYERRKTDIGHPTTNLLSEDSEEEEDLIGYDPVEPGLPPASSDRQKWWLENGKMAQSTVGPPSGLSGNDSSTIILNPNRPSNPFHPTDEPDWVAVPRSGSRLSSFSSISSSPYEQINHSTLLSTSASSSAPRKLPPPFDHAALPAKVGRLGLAEEQTSRSPNKNEAPPPPPPRRQTAAQTPSQPIPTRSQTFPVAPSSASLVSQASPASTSADRSKPGPPVARKPAHLASASPTNTAPASDSGQFPAFVSANARHTIPRKPTSRVSDLTSKLESSGSGSLRGGMQNPLPPPLQPERVSHSPTSSIHSTSSAPSGRVSLPGLGKVERKPVNGTPRPPQQQGTTAQPIPPPPAKPVRKPTTVDLLGDDEPSGMGSWETLKPS